MITALIALSTSAPLLLVGMNDVDITPPEPLPLGGYTARQGKLFQAGGEPLLARVLTLRYGGSTMALVSLDMLTVPESLVREVKSKLPSGATVFMVATHTHSAPDSQMLNDRMTFAIPGIASYKSRWLDWYSERIAAGILTTRPTTKVSRVLIEERRLAANRGRRAGAVPDTMATRVVAMGQESVNLFFSYSAHGTVLDADQLKTSPDWPGVVRDWGLFLPGAIGDVSPKTEGSSPEERMASMRRALRAPKPFFESTIWGDRQRSFAYVEQVIPLDPVASHPAFAADNHIAPSLATILITKFAPVSAHISAFRIGKLAVVGIPGEPTSVLGKTISAFGKSLGFTSVLVTSHVNGWMGYILAPDDYDRGGYEASLSFYGREEGNLVVRAAETALRSLVTTSGK
jgi:hypothetical protein